MKTIAKSVLSNLGYEVKRKGQPQDSAPSPNWSKSRYQCLLELFAQEAPGRMIEIGVWKGDRSVQFLQQGRNLAEYVGFDLFEELTEDVAQSEKMGLCRATQYDQVKERILQSRAHETPSVEIIKGYTEKTLPEFARRRGPEFDFIFIDGGHSLQTVRNDWEYSMRLLAPNGVIVFDDYLMNDTSRGAKPMVDELLADDRFVVRFFPVIEDIIEGLQITMAAVRWRKSSV
jgi:hypothetical protein